MNAFKLIEGGLMERVPDVPVPTGARVMAAVATLCALPFAVWWIAVGSGMSGGLAVGTVATLLPQLAVRAAGFRWACWVVAAVLLATSVVGLLLGLFLLAPAALVLLPAGARSSARAGCLSTVLGGAFAFVTLAGTGTVFVQSWVAPQFREPDVYTATVDGAPPAVVARELDSEATGIPALGHGAISVYFDDLGGQQEGRMTVRFTPGTPRSELEALRERISALPGIHDVKLCNSSADECN
ncbi:hypothetical protein [Kitasatospora sp. NPDC005856]|uniref:hypothetical protein n=1 Tax=Kitasatospora sp. NPDC005856 TaxID=3154566 RepID=UPI003408E3A6